MVSNWHSELRKLLNGKLKNLCSCGGIQLILIEVKFATTKLQKLGNFHGRRVGVTNRMQLSFPRDQYVVAVVRILVMRHVVKIYWRLQN